MSTKQSAAGVLIPPAAPSDTVLKIRYGHSVDTRKVLVSFNAQVSSIIFSPEDAEDVAKKLLYYAEAARGNKSS